MLRCRRGRRTQVPDRGSLARYPYTHTSATSSPPIFTRLAPHKNRMPRAGIAPQARLHHGRCGRPDGPAREQWGCLPRKPTVASAVCPEWVSSVCVLVVSVRVFDGPQAFLGIGGCRPFSRQWADLGAHPSGCTLCPTLRAGDKTEPHFSRRGACRLGGVHCLTQLARKARPQTDCAHTDLALGSCLVACTALGDQRNTPIPFQLVRGTRVRLPLSGPPQLPFSLGFRPERHGRSFDECRRNRFPSSKVRWRKKGS